MYIVFICIFLYIFFIQDVDDVPEEEGRGEEGVHQQQQRRGPGEEKREERKERKGSEIERVETFTAHRKMQTFFYNL